MKKNNEKAKAPNVTPLQGNPYKNEFADWSVHDLTNGSSIIFDNHFPGIFTKQARSLVQSSSQHSIYRPGHSALHISAHNGRRVKFTTKTPGCDDQDTPFLPLINTATGAFVPFTSSLPELPADMKTNIQRVFGGSDNDWNTGSSGDRPRSVEEALLRRWARRAADHEHTSVGVYDKTLSLTRAAGSLTADVYRRIAHAAIKHSASGVANCLRSCGLLLRG